MAMAIGEISQRCAMAGGARRGEGLAQGWWSGGRRQAGGIVSVWRVGGGRWAPPDAGLEAEHVVGFEVGREVGLEVRDPTS